MKNVNIKMQNDKVKFKILRWGTWPYWARGGAIVLLSVTVVVLLLTLLDNMFRPPQSEISVWGMMAMILFSWGYILMPWSDSASWTQILVNAAIYFFLGSLVGWLYGIIKNRNNATSQNIIH